MKSVLFLIASSRVGGNSELLAKEASTMLDPSIAQTWIRLCEYPIGDFQDVRHDGERQYLMPEGNALHLLKATVKADVIVFASPLYWYSMPAPLKLYLDHWSHWMRVPELDFKATMKGKPMYLTSSMAGENPMEAEPLIRSLQLTADYMGMPWGGHVLAHANAAGDVLQQEETLATARGLLLNL